MNNQEQSLSTVAYAEGCKRYYSFKSEYKYDRKKKDDDDGGGGGCNAVDPVITLYSAIMQNNGDLMLRGKVEPATDEECEEVPFDYNSLVPDFMGNISVSGTPVIELTSFKRTTYKVKVYLLSTNFFFFYIIFC